VAVDVIGNFLNESEEHKVVYVGMSHHGREIFDKIESDRLLAIGVDDES